MKLSKAIVNLSIGSENSWYHRGQKRLAESVKGEEMFFASYESPLHGTVYEDKIAHIKHAGQYYDMILWLDCSITATKSLKQIWKHIEKNGVYLYQSGANCAETCNTNCLKYYDITPDFAERIPECASNVVGINLKHPKGKKFFDLWTGSLNSDANKGYKWPSITERLGDSLDSRFKYSRQDQSTASLSAYRAGIKLDKEGNFVVRAENIGNFDNDSICLVLKGGVGE